MGPKPSGNSKANSLPKTSCQATKWTAIPFLALCPFWGPWGWEGLGTEGSSDREEKPR